MSIAKFPLGGEPIQPQPGRAQGASAWRRRRMAPMGLCGGPPAVLWLGFLIVFWLAGAETALGQVAATARNAYTPMGQRLTSAMVRDEVERRLSLNPKNEASLWNTGYDFFRNYPHNQDTALAIKDGFLRAWRQNSDPQQRVLLMKAAVYWEKIHDYGIKNVPVGIDHNNRQKTYYGDTSKFSTLGMRKSGGSHQSFNNRDWPGRNIGRRQPYKGRPDNPYPGKYYPGVYPP